MPSSALANVMRKSYSSLKRVLEVPYLVEIQQKSFKEFLQIDVDPDKRANVGLQAALNSVFPIKDFNNTASLEFISYRFDPPKYTVDEARHKGTTYAAPMFVLTRLIIYDVDEETGARTIRDIKEQEVFFGEIPLMTQTGTFIINGTERVVVSQLHRSPGVFYEHDEGKTHSSGKLLYSARIIPNRGSWLDFEFDARDLVHVRIDRRKKLFATIMLRALGYTKEELLNYFYKTEIVTYDNRKYEKTVVPEVLIYQTASRDIHDPKTGETIIKEGKRFNRRIVERLVSSKIKTIPIKEDDLIGKIVGKDIIDPSTGEVIIDAGAELNKSKLEELRAKKINEIPILFIDGLNVGYHIRNTLLADKVSTPEEARLEIYRKMRPGDPPSKEAADQLFENLFSNPGRYDLSKVGRLKINHKFGFDVPLEICTLRKEDILAIVKYLVDLKDGYGTVDDIDHLGNRRVRTVGELLENQFRVGLVRMERAIKEKMSLQEIDTLMPHDLVNARPVMAVVREFFASSQLSQFMDQTNPLSEITHKRRLSALGPGGLTRERAGFEVRDVHPTHYGRICPIETPEGPNIGLISSLSTYAKINEYGFIETPYRKVVNGKVTDEIIYCSALEEEKYYIAQANEPVDGRGHFTSEFVQARYKGETVNIPATQVQLIDVSPDQLVSVAAAIVPFLEHDDANRALMGSNMQRQAVPLVVTEAPIVSTGIEKVVARDSGAVIVCQRSGIVTEVDANRIIVRVDKRAKKGELDVDIYNLTKYRRSNQGSCINQIPIVNVGDKVKEGDILADGPATAGGELAFGRNVLVAFMPWGGYNFEDSILVSEKLAKGDVFTSIHIEEFECTARDTKLGKEEITRDIPNVGEDALANLDDSGIVRIGAEVKTGDILVGKVTPKGETQLSPEERLLRAIFGEKAADVKDTSLRVPPGIKGVVIGAHVFSREGIQLDERAKGIKDEENAKILEEMNAKLKEVKDGAFKQLKRLLVGRISSSRVVSDDEEERVLIPKGKPITEAMLASVPPSKWGEISVEGGEDIEDEIEEILDSLSDQEEIIKLEMEQKSSKLKMGDELPPGVVKIVKVYVAIKRKLQVGDKMSGRHGNKGVVSVVLPEEDMPYLPDGRPVDIVLNPLGVPSRMNVGQILETHLGMAGRVLGEKLDEMLKEKWDRSEISKFLKKVYKSKEMDEFLENATNADFYKMCNALRKGIPFMSPVFDGAKERDIKALFELADLPHDGQTILFDGRTGEPFDRPVTVGVMYMMKLHHLVEDKIHARSIGPYSLVTQQPLGGKAQFGGQRLGEMEVWALEAYGAAYSLQEFLTVKSDDIAGRNRMYESIVKGEYTLDPGVPESFNVMIKELQSLALNAELLEDGKEN